MESKILTFWIIVFIFMWLLKLRPESKFTKAAFSWIGPIPKSGETLSRFYLRWAVYSFGWLCQLCLIFSALWYFMSRSPDIYSSIWFQLFWFAIPFGIGISLLALLGFIFKTVKAHYINPNAVWTGESNKMD
jgi:hypothetical protein